MSTIENNVTAKEFRERVEDKNTLDKKGVLYVGTGERNTEETNAYKTVATPLPKENSVLVKDDTQEGGLGWKNIVDAVNAAASDPQNPKAVSYATNATTAQSYGINGTIYSKFTSVDNKISDIEERLTNLGFKEGSISLSSEIASISSVLENKITRQGNYCLFNFIIGSTAVFIESEASIAIGSVPTNFLPLEVVTITCRGMIASNEWLGFDITIQKNGEIVLRNMSKEKVLLGNLFVWGAGYEAKPLS